jgi:energy-coupling factor transport system ATP-binding protein
MGGYEKKSPHMLSGGQKQRIALAGILAVSPEIIIFDESTAMLDPEGRTEILKIIEVLNKENNKSIILITHYVEETVKADRIFVMYEGKILKAGKTGEILCDKELLTKAGLVPPLPVRIYHDLSDAGITLPFCPLTDEELCKAICQLN